MHPLIKRIQQCRTNVFACQRRLFYRLVGGQQPLALSFTCSGSRIDPSLLTQTKPGDLFVMRNAGNIVGPYRAVHGGDAATIEYTVATPKVQDVIVCGRSHCGAMNGVLHPEQLGESPAFHAWLVHAEATGQIIRESYSYLVDESQRLDSTVAEERARAVRKSADPSFYGDCLVTWRLETPRLGLQFRDRPSVYLRTPAARVDALNH